MDTNDSYQIIRVDQSLYSIEEEGVRSFLIIGHTKAFLIDTGFGKGSLGAFIKSFTNLPVTLLTTHCDPDHIGCHNEFSAASMHPAEFHRFRQKKPDYTTALLPLQDGDIIDCETRKLEVLCIPGHTPGSVAFLDKENRILIGGDSIQRGPIFMFGEGRNVEALIVSLEKLSGRQGEFATILASHGPLKEDAGLIRQVIDGARLLLSGKVTGVQPPRLLPCLLYDCNGIKFFY